MKHRVVLLLSLSLMLASSGALADRRAPVDELKIGQPDSTPQVTEVNQPQADMYYQVQVLQEEVRQLRGLLEELSYELKQLKQRQMDDYLDLDRRLSTRGGSAPASQPGANTADPATASGYLSSGSGAVAASDDAEKDHYSDAYLLLRDKRMDEAVTAFQQHVQRYPNGNYTANAHYWLGEIYVLKGRLEDARQSFMMVVDNFPTHRKAPDAALGLGKVFHQLGDNAKAREWLEKVAAGNSAAARKARQYLTDNF